MITFKRLIGLALPIVVAFIGGSFAFRQTSTGSRVDRNSLFSIVNAKCVENIMPIVVIGSGPAALSTALYTSRSGVKTLVVAGDKPGGALTETTFIENWPGRAKILGNSLMEEFRRQVGQFGVTFLSDMVSAIEVTQWPYCVKTASGKSIHAMAVIVATGSTPKKLGIPGEAAYWGKGVTTCAVCDAPFCKGKEVVVVGGGDTAAEEAMQLAPHAQKITVLVRKSNMRASAAMQDRLKSYPNVVVSYNKEVVAIEGDGTHVAGIELVDNSTNTRQKLATHSVFLSIGQTPNTALVQNIVATDSQGYVCVENRSQRTSKPFVYAAGDVADECYKQAGVAAGDGIKAALDAVGDLQKIGYCPAVALALEKNLFDAGCYATKPVSIVSTIKEFDTILANARGPVILDFFADYCPSCMRMLPAIESVAQQLDKEVEFYKIDMADSDELAQKYKVSSIPTLLVFSDGTLISRYTEAMNKQELHEYALRFVKPKQRAA